MQKQQEKHTKELKKCRVLGPVATIFAGSNTGSWRLERPVIDYEKCIKCGTCERFCPTNVIDVYKDRAECVVVNFDYCKGCGICVNECPAKCMKMIPERGEE
ncbi:4Fe-4S binding protein [Sedimentibacter sp.]|uniref:4Fe-4S binding protein n=1 Tax=Sedimentibacter sp. TaxID=1960295 RepID=UPI0028AF4178|nr:4Fe-4S binding protein [Sedimentibacter sp.]